jgi:hypothetical protein
MGDFGAVLGLLSPMMGADATAFLNNFNQAVPPLADAAAWSHLMKVRGHNRSSWRTGRCCNRRLGRSCPSSMASIQRRQLERLRPKS